MGADDKPPALIMLIVDGREYALGDKTSSSKTDLCLINDFLRLRLAATRAGLPVRVTYLDERVRELLTFIGLADQEE